MSARLEPEPDGALPVRCDIFAVACQDQGLPKIGFVLSGRALTLEGGMLDQFPTKAEGGRPSVGHEQRFWRAAGVAWRQLAGDIDQHGFSFEWHESSASQSVPWSESFHPHSIEICLNLAGQGFLMANRTPVQLGPDRSVVFGNNGGQLRGERAPGQRHQFLSVAYSLEFLRQHLKNGFSDLSPMVRDCLESHTGIAAVSGVQFLNHRQRDLLQGLLHPPVFRPAQLLWYEGKALEFAAEFLFESDPEPLCSRARRLAQERVAKAKAVLSAHLGESVSLVELGRRVGCSPFYLSRTFTQETGMTISRWLRQARLERAAELLRSRACNVTEAALQVGYSSLSHFSQAFRETFGCCPGLYPLRTDSPWFPESRPRTGGRNEPTRGHE
jgi:AraC-like DNA-binding protein